MGGPSLRRRAPYIYIHTALYSALIDQCIFTDLRAAELISAVQIVQGMERD